MADLEKNHESGVYAHDVDSAGSEHATANQADLPTGWRYRQPNAGCVKLPYYASPTAQLLLVSFVCFLCPGMFNALSGMGGGGQVDASTVDIANLTLYGVFAVVGFFAGSICNRIGVRATLAIGGIGYCIYIASFLSYNINQNPGFNIAAGAILGLCAGMLWTAQGAIMMAYPEEHNKGKYISLFWVIFNMGAVIGGLIPLGQNFNVKTNSNVTNGTYIAFLVLTFLGALMALTLVNSNDVVRPDGSRIIIMKNPTWLSEIKGLGQTLKSDIWVVALFPMFWSSNWFYTYQFNDVNGAHFTTRTKALNSILYWFMQIFGATLFGFCLDLRCVSRPARARLAWAALLVMTMAVWGGGFAYQTSYTRAQTEAADFEFTDWTTEGYVGPMFLYMFYGFYDASWQTCVYWFMGALTNNGRKLANFAGFYKGIQSAGAATVFAIDFDKIPFMNMLASCWALLGGSLLIAAPLIWCKIRDSVPLEEDLVFSDETFEEVAGVNDGNRAAGVRQASIDAVQTRRGHYKQASEGII